MNIKNKLIYFLGGISFAEHYNVLQRNKQYDYKQGHDNAIVALYNLINDISGCDSQTWIDTVYNAIYNEHKKV